MILHTTLKGSSHTYAPKSSNKVNRGLGYLATLISYLRLAREFGGQSESEENRMSFRLCLRYFKQSVNNNSLHLRCRKEGTWGFILHRFCLKVNFDLKGIFWIGRINQRCQRKKQNHLFSKLPLYILNVRNACYFNPGTKRG